MPNWCDTTLTISTYDHDKAEEFGKLIKEWTSKDYCENGFYSHSWLGNIVGNSGLAKYDKEKGVFLTDDGVQIRCRGSLEDVMVDGDEVHLYMNYAWAPMLRMWRLLVEKYLPNADITLRAEEPGCGLYATNDPWYEGCFYVDAWEVPEAYRPKLKTLIANSADISLYAETEDNCRKLLQTLLDTDETDMYKLIDRCNEELDWLIVHKWKHADVMDFDE